MSNLIFKDNSIRTKGDMVCLTDMAKPFTKTVAHWLENQTTKSFLSALSADIGIPISLLIETSDAGTLF
jgi:hypothetical protein